MALASALALPTGAARAENFQAEFDKVFGKELRAPREVQGTVRPFQRCRVLVGHVPRTTATQVSLWKRSGWPVPSGANSPNA